MQVINTNVASLVAQRNLGSNQSSLTTALERLSSGFRINSARDDAAGLAITERMSSQIRGMNQAMRNANDGISLAQTAEGDLVQIGNNLQRLRELAVQSANASNSQSDRDALNVEAAQLISEIDRVASVSSFNGVNLLDGTFSNQQFQVGAFATANDRVTITSIASARTTALGASFSATVTSSAVNSTAISSGNVTLNGVNVIDSVSDGVSTVGATASAKAKATAINSTSGIGGVTATAVTNVASATTGTTAGTGTITINGITTNTITLGATAATNRTNIASAINAVSAATGVVATDDGTGISLRAADGRNIDTTYTQASGTFTATTLGMAAAGTNYGTLTLTRSGPGGITAGGTVAIIGSPATTSSTQTGTAVSQLNISSVAGANTAITSLDAALNSINSSRATLGSIQNRFESVVASLQVSSENLTTSRSRIRDADFAQETAALSRAQILQQAGTAMLAQANALPQGVLQLLRG